MNRKSQVSPRFYIILLILTVIIVGGLYKFCLSRCEGAENTLNEVQQQRNDLEEEVVELDELLAFTQTDDYVIRVARDELDMLMPGEIRYSTS